MNTPASTSTLTDPSMPLRTEKAPMGILGLLGPNHYRALCKARQICERGPAGAVTGPPLLPIGDLARNPPERLEWTGAGAAERTGGGSPGLPGPERSVRLSGAEGHRAGSAEATRKGESPTDGQTPIAFAVGARAPQTSVPKESRPGTEPEARTDRGPEAERAGQSAKACSTPLLAPPVPGAADAGWHRAKLQGAGYVVPCLEPHCGYYVCPRNCGCGSDETCRQCGHRQHDGEEFGLGGLPSVPRGPTQQNHTRETEGRPAPFRSH